MLFAATTHSVYYYIGGFIAGFAMIARGIMLMRQQRAQRAMAQEAVAQASASTDKTQEKQPPPPPPPPEEPLP